jgi:anti-sigma28 factor (negative regulator of flagellin synthesis)
MCVCCVYAELQKHYSAIQALALGEDVLAFDEKKDTTLPDEEGFSQSDVKVCAVGLESGAVLSFNEHCGSSSGRDRLVPRSLRRRLDRHVEPETQGQCVLLLVIIRRLINSDANLLLSSLLLQIATPASRSSGTKKRAAAPKKEGAAVAVDSADAEEWTALVASNTIQKKTVAQLKEFLHAHGLPMSGEKAELIEAIKGFLEK